MECEHEWVDAPGSEDGLGVEIDEKGIMWVPVICSKCNAESKERWEKIGGKQDDEKI